jgi:toxin ParE1/3/4
MANYIIGNEAKEDLIKIHHYGVKKFGISQLEREISIPFLSTLI